MSFFRDGLSVDEMKVSTMIICLLMSMGMALWKTFKYGDFSSNLLDLIKALIIAVAAVNVANIAADKFDFKKKEPP
jgi:hypothetical protein